MMLLPLAAWGAAHCSTEGGSAEACSADKTTDASALLQSQIGVQRNLEAELEDNVRMEDDGKSEDGDGVADTPDDGATAEGPEKWAEPEDEGARPGKGAPPAPPAPARPGKGGKKGKDGNGAGLSQMSGLSQTEEGQPGEDGKDGKDGEEDGAPPCASTCPQETEPSCDDFKSFIAPGGCAENCDDAVKDEFVAKFCDGEDSDVPDGPSDKPLTEVPDSVPYSSLTEEVPYR